VERKIVVRGVLSKVERLQAEQTDLIEASSSTTQEQYSHALQGLIEEKHDQIERLEWAIDDQLEKTEEALQNLKSRQPGFFAKRDAKAQWDQSVQKLEQRRETLRTRHEIVREISEETSLNGARVQANAVSKLALREPELVGRWEKEQAEEIKRVAAERSLRKTMRQNDKSQGRAPGLALGRALE
jgi:hypothetical protein